MEAGSTRRGIKASVAVAIRGEGEAGADVVLREFRKVREDFGLAHAAGKVVEHVVDGDAEVSNAGLAAASGGSTVMMYL